MFEKLSGPRTAVLGARAALFVLLFGMFATSGRGAWNRPMLIVSGTEDGWQGRPDDYVTTFTSAAAITLPSTGYSLRRVRVDVTTVPGAFKLIYDGISVALFPAGSNATSGTATWACNWPVRGIVIGSAIQAFVRGTAPTATLTFSKGGSNAPSMDAYRAISFTNSTQHTSATALTAITYDGGESVPRGVIALSTVQGNQFLWPGVGAAQALVLADFTPGAAVFHSAPTLPKSTTLTPSVLTPSTQGVSDFYVYYDPV